MFTSTWLLTKEGATRFLLKTLWRGLPHSLVFPVCWGWWGLPHSFVCCKIHVERFYRRSRSLSCRRSGRHPACSRTSLRSSLRQQSTVVLSFFQYSPSPLKSYLPLVLNMRLASAAPLTSGDNKYLKKIFNNYVKESTCIVMWETCRL